MHVTKWYTVLERNRYTYQCVLYFCKTTTQLQFLLNPHLQNLRLFTRITACYNTLFVITNLSNRIETVAACSVNSVTFEFSYVVNPSPDPEVASLLPHVTVRARALRQFGEKQLSDRMVVEVSEEPGNTRRFRAAWHCSYFVEPRAKSTCNAEWSDKQNVCGLRCCTTTFRISLTT